MRKLSILLFFSITVHSQVYKIDSVYSFKYTESIKFILDDFFEGCAKYDIPLDRFSDLGGLHVIPNIGSFGITFFRKERKDIILVSNDIPIYLPTFMSAVIYHELYHFISEIKQHCVVEPPTFKSKIEEVIKGYPNCLYLLQSGDNISVEKVIREWNDNAKKEYFLFLKSNI